MKRVILTGQWIMQFPDRQRRFLLRDIFEVADEQAWEVLMHGQHWSR